MSRTLCQCVCLLTVLVVSVRSHPLKTNDTAFQEVLDERNTKIQVIDEIYERLENMVGDNLGRLYNKINSLTLVTEQLMQQTREREPVISYGERGDMSQRCPRGFRAIAGGNMCYYFSNYKLPWHMAKEECQTLGSEVEMLSLQFTKQQYVVSHLIQSDPNAKKVKKWWTSARGLYDHPFGYRWEWIMGLKSEPFFSEFWADESSKADNSPDADSCAVLDSSSYYRWKKVKCGITKQSLDDMPAHHFICQQRPAEEINIRDLIATQRPLNIETRATNTAAPVESLETSHSNL